MKRWDSLFGGMLLLGFVMSLLAAQESAAVTPAKTPWSTPWIRIGHAIEHAKLDPKERYLAFADANGMGLKVLHLKTQKILTVSAYKIGESYFWAPDGYRLFYRELHANRRGEVKSVVKAFDTKLNRSVEIDAIPQQTGFLTFDPRDLRMQLLGPFGIRTKRINFPDERLARWQVAQRTDNGKWLANPNGILWITQGGLAMRRLGEDRGKIQSFDISPDGTTIAWTNEKDELFISNSGKEPVMLDYGRDPKWHPHRSLLLYAGGRVVGNKAVSFDVKISDTRGSGRFLTASQSINERWPQWYSDGERILFTKEKTTDLFVMELRD